MSTAKSFLDRDSDAAAFPNKVSSLLHAHRAGGYESVRPVSPRLSVSGVEKFACIYPIRGRCESLHTKPTRLVESSARNVLLIKMMASQ